VASCEEGHPSFYPEKITIIDSNLRQHPFIDSGGIGR